MTQLHLDILLRLRAAYPYGFPLETILTDVRAVRPQHRSVSRPQLEKSLRDLADKDFAAPVESPLGERWRITSTGISALQDEGLA